MAAARRCGIDRRESANHAMRILLSNDDGYFAPGLERLAADLAPYADITVVAPERDRSGASNSLTLDRPLTVRRAANGFLFVNGTPTDCVHLAVTGLLDELPDMVISGINHGANMGDDTIYSGTVAAATEGYLLGIPSIAVSLASKAGQHFETAAKIVVDLVAAPSPQAVGRMAAQRQCARRAGRATSKDVRVTRLGKRHKAEPVVKTETPRGETCYWVGAAGAAPDAGEGTDFHAVGHRLRVGHAAADRPDPPQRNAAHRRMDRGMRLRAEPRLEPKARASDAMTAGVEKFAASA